MANSKLVTIRLPLTMIEEVDELLAGMSSESHLNLTRASVMRSAMSRGITSLKRTIRRKESLGGGGALFVSPRDGSEDNQPSQDP